MVVKKLAPAMVTVLVLSVAVTAPPAAAQQQQASQVTDSSFIQMANSLGLLQIKLGKLAEKKGSSAAVVEFGKRMVSDYSKTNQQLAAAAKQAAFPGPVLLRQHQTVADRFNGLSRDSFDKAYVTEIVKYHREEVQLFQQESEGGRIQSLKELASSLLPEVEQRLALATETAGSVGADVTASKPGAGQEPAGN